MPPRRAAVVFLLAPLLLLGTFASPNRSWALPSVNEPADAAPVALRAGVELDASTLDAWGIAHPARLAFDPEGFLYVLDVSRARLIKVDPDGRLVHEVSIRGEDAAARAQPSDVIVDARGSVLVLDRAAPAILAFDKQGALLATRPFAPELADEARDPRAILMLDPFGRLWLAAPRERDLVRLDASLRRDRAARFLTPDDAVPPIGAAAAVGNGDLWIAETGSGAVQRFRASGSLAETTALPEMPGVVAAIAGLTADRGGHLFLADRKGQRIVVLGPAGALELDRLLGGEAHPFRPGAIAWSPFDRLAVADVERNVIQILVVERGRP